MHMHFYVVLLSEFFGTNFTHVWPLASVNRFMLRQLIPTFVTLVTSLTLELVSGVLERKPVI